MLRKELLETIRAGQKQLSSEAASEIAEDVDDDARGAPIPQKGDWSSALSRVSKRGANSISLAWSAICNIYLRPLLIAGHVLSESTSDGVITELQRKEQPGFQQTRCSPDTKEEIVRSQGFQSALHFADRKMGLNKLRSHSRIAVGERTLRPSEKRFHAYAFANQRAIRNWIVVQ
jgi:hypothetical protein